MTWPSAWRQFLAVIGPQRHGGRRRCPWRPCGDQSAGHRAEYAHPPVPPSSTLTDPPPPQAPLGLAEACARCGLHPAAAAELIGSGEPCRMPASQWCVVEMIRRQLAPRDRRLVRITFGGGPRS